MYSSGISCTQDLLQFEENEHHIYVHLLSKYNMSMDIDADNWK